MKHLLGFIGELYWKVAMAKRQGSGAGEEEPHPVLVPN